MKLFGWHLISPIFRGSELLSCPHGIYKIYWKSGGSSLASIGSMHNGERWIAPINWTSENDPTGRMFEMMGSIKKAELIKQ